MESYIRESLRTSDAITVKVMAVSLHYSWDFLKNDLRLIMSDLPEYKRITLDLEMVDPDHLGAMNAPDWREKGQHIEADIAAFVNKDKSAEKLVESRRLEVFLYQYRNIPNWHGTLINNQYLFLGRTRWAVHSDKHIFKLSVGEETYRLFASNDVFGGPDRISLFNSWFDYYKHAGKLVIAACRNE